MACLWARLRLLSSTLLFTRCAVAALSMASPFRLPMLISCEACAYDRPEGESNRTQYERRSFDTDTKMETVLWALLALEAHANTFSRTMAG